VNQAFVRAFLSDADPVGAVFHRSGDPTDYTIVGVIGDTRRQDITTEPVPEVLWPHTQRPWGMSLAIRTSGDPLSFGAAVRGVIHRVDSSIVVKNVSTLDRQMDRRIAQRSFQTWLLGGFSLLALLLAALGIYGMMQYSVSERTQEIGVRIALGATRRDILALVLRDALWLACAGMAVGVPVALGTTRLLDTFLYGVSAHDPLTFGAAFGLLTGAALMASALPARRAAACDPQAALRRE
jgi:ABC-type antimicrobial peptide transport system permease subunit